jgi:hypothetical protein
LLFHYPPATTARSFNASDTKTPNDRLVDCPTQGALARGIKSFKFGYSELTAQKKGYNTDVRGMGC